jgi:hypothetical protein
MIFELRANGRVILRVNAWYLVLSAILRGDVSSKRILSLGDLDLTAEWEIETGFYGQPPTRHSLPIRQPPEFIGDSLKKE